MKNKIKKILTSNSINRLRNLINYKPTISLKPIDPNSSVSDFFYWDTRNSFDTRIMLTNFSTQTLPDNPQVDNIKVIIYDNNGKKNKELNILLDPFKTKELIFSEIIDDNYGSFFVFHKLDNMEEYKKKNSHLSERGYISYKKDNGIWSFMHGNLNTAYFDYNLNKPICIFTKSLFANNTYMPQVSFKNCKSFSFILNNPMNETMNVNADFLDSKMNKVITKYFKLSPFSTLKYFEEDKKICFFKITSNIIFLRPIIMKESETYFDIFHG